VGIAMNPQNGEILAMYSNPGYDNNWFINGITPEQMQQLNSDDRRPLVNKAIGEHLSARLDVQDGHQACRRSMRASRTAGRS
jgi:hypothetical protein